MLRSHGLLWWEDNDLSLVDLTSNVVNMEQFCLVRGKGHRCIASSGMQTAEWRCCVWASTELWPPLWELMLSKFNKTQVNKNSLCTCNHDSVCLYNALIENTAWDDATGVESSFFFPYWIQTVANTYTQSSEVFLLSASELHNLH